MFELMEDNCGSVAQEIEFLESSIFHLESPIFQPFSRRALGVRKSDGAIVHLFVDGDKMLVSCTQEGFSEPE